MTTAANQLPAEPIDPRLPIQRLPATRSAITAKLFNHLQLTFDRTPSLRDPISQIQRTSPFTFLNVVSTHMNISQQSAAEAIAASTILDDLINRICELRGITSHQDDQLDMFRQ